jgi:riboflavin kinase / FMN adenylyltransferase
MLAAAIGKFDALHRGHRALIETARACGDPVLLTFAHQAEILGWTPRPPLVAPDDRARVLTEWHCTERSLDFAAIRELSPAQFLAHLRTLGIGAVVVGEDFRFGHARVAGSAELPALAAAAGLEQRIVPAVCAGTAVVSSSTVRTALATGDVAQVAALLGRPYRLCGTVVRGDGRGRGLGIPTANCGALRNLAPAGGVYAARAWLGGRGPYAAAVNAGHVPTAGGERPFVVEAHLIEWTGDAYGQPLALDFVARLRDEQRFASFPELLTQIHADLAATRIALAS